VRLLVVLLALVAHQAYGGTNIREFPTDFLWGSATASYQVEGAYNISRGLSIWDIFSHTPGKTANGDTGDVADDQYHRYREDIQLLTGVGFNSYRLSLSWPRLFPTGRPPLNQVAVDHYNDVINGLLANGVTPFVTLYHWDLPLELHKVVGGWLSEDIVEYFGIYADAAFSSFGDRVKHWTTFNEPLSFTQLGYASNGLHAPGRCSDRNFCTAGNSSTEPYIAAHNVILAHAAAVNIYRTRYQSKQKGVIGITLNCDWAEPYTNSTADRDAAERHLEFQLAWYADPIFKGDYPDSMKRLVGERLPQFTNAQKKFVKGSWDFFGLNHYTSLYNLDRPAPPPNFVSGGWSDDQRVDYSTTRDGKLIGPAADSSWLYVVPWGIRKMLHWVADRYDKPPIYITENGVDVPNEGQLPLQQALVDTFRVDYYDQYLSNVSAAMQDGVDVKGYFAWSLMDNFEWADGYTKRFGLHYVDYKNNLTRYPKESAKWFRSFIKGF